MDHGRTSKSQVEKPNPLLCGVCIGPSEEGCGKHECNWCYIPPLGSSKPKMVTIDKKIARLKMMITFGVGNEDMHSEIKRLHALWGRYILGWAKYRGHYTCKYCGYKMHNYTPSDPHCIICDECHVNMG